MLDNGVRHPVVPSPHRPGYAMPSTAQPIAEIDPDDDHVVPQALTAMVTAVQDVNTAMAGNSAYTATEAVSAVAQVIDMLSTTTRHLEAYVGDYSKPAERHLVLVTNDLVRATKTLARLTKTLAHLGRIMDEVRAEIEPLEATSPTGDPTSD